MYQKLSIVSLLALSATTNASPSRFAKRVAQDLDPLVGGESDIYTTFQRPGDPNNEIPLLGPGIYTTIDGIVPETPDVQEVPGQPDVPPIAPEAPVVPESPDAYTTVEEGEVPSLMPEVPYVPPVDSPFTETAVYDPELTAAPSTPSLSLEPTTIGDDGVDTMTEADAEATDPLTSMGVPTSLNGTASESSTIGFNQTTSLAPSDLTTVTIYSSTTYTITDCGPTVLCSGGADETLTSTIAISTTICPVSEATKFATVAPNPPRVTVVEGVYDQEVVVDVDGDYLTTTIPLTSTQTVTEFVTANDAKATNEVVVVDEVEDVDNVANEFVPSGGEVVNDVKEGSGDFAGDVFDGGDVVDGGNVGHSFDDEDEATLTVSSTMTVFDVVTVAPTGSVEGSPGIEGFDSGNVDSGNVDSHSSGSDGFSDGSSEGTGSGSGGIAAECVPIVETVTERETVTAEPVTIVETVTVAFTSNDAPFVATMSNSTGLGSFNQTATHTVEVIECSTDAVDVEHTDKPCGVYVVEVEPTPEAEVTEVPCCFAVDDSDNIVDAVPTSFARVPKAAESPIEPVYGYDAYDSYESY